MNPLSRSSAECCGNKRLPAGKKVSLHQTEALVGCLQKLPTQYHWVFADQLLLLAIARGEPIVRGNLGGKLGNLVKVSRHLWLVWPLLSLVGAVELVRLLFRQRKSMQNECSQSGNYPARFFVGFGAGSEEELFKQYCEIHSGNVKKLNQIDTGSFTVWHFVGIAPGFRALIHSLAVARMAIADLPSELAPWSADFLTYVGMRVGYFAYMRAWFEILGEKTGRRFDEIAFLAADTAAFAAVDAGLPACYIQHGLLPYSTLLPDFARIEALTADEADFMLKRLPKAHITMCPRQKLKLIPSQMKKEALITSIYRLSDYRSSSNNMHSGIASFLSWASDKKLPVRVRPHPCEKDGFWFGYEANGKLTIEAEDASFLQSVDRLRPRINVSWFSTTLAEALEYGVIPVTVCTDDDQDVAEIIYPMFQRCLRWPQDAESIARLLDDDEYYDFMLARLRTVSGGGERIVDKYSEAEKLTRE